MRKVTTTHAFLKDLKLSKKRGKCLLKLKVVIETLARRSYLAHKYHPHRLTGGAHDFFECHVENDWLLVYKLTTDELELVRLGSHSDLFR
jgi:mRNA interferase YafQ